MTDINLWIEQEAFMKLRYYVEGCEKEISGLGFVRQDSEKEFAIYDFFIFKQIVSDAHASISADAMSDVLDEMVKGKKKVEDIKLWWHSHADMQAFFSPTDDKTIENANEFDLLFSIVTNHDMDFKGRMDMKRPLLIQDVEVNVLLAERENEKLKKAILKEIAEKVTEPIPKIYGTHAGFGGTHHDTQETGYLNEFGKDKIPKIPSTHNDTSLFNFNEGELEEMLSKEDLEDEVGEDKLVVCKHIKENGKEYLQKIFTSGISILVLWSSVSKKEKKRLASIASKNVRVLYEDKVTEKPEKNTTKDTKDSKISTILTPPAKKTLPL